MSRFTQIAAVTLIAALSLSAQAEHVTTLAGGTALNMPVMNYFGSGPQNLAPDIVWSSDYSASVFGYVNGYGFASNGAWSGSGLTMVGNNSRTATMTFTFANSVAGFGGFMNYAPGHGTATIAAYDASNTLIESYTLNFATGGGSNTGEFHGFLQSTASIKRFTMTGAYIGGANFSVQAAPVPEPETYALMLAGLAGVAAVARRRRSA